MVKCKVCGKTYHDNIAICSHCGAPIDNYVSADNSISKELVKKGILESKKRVDKIEGVNVPYISLFILIAITGFALKVVSNIIPYNDIFLFNCDNLGKYSVNTVIALSSYIFSWTGMVYMFYCLKKVMIITETPMTSLINACIFFCCLCNAMIIFTIMIGVYSKSNFSSLFVTIFNILKNTVYMIYIIYIVLTFIFSRRLIETYEGALKYLGIFLYLLSWYRLFYTILFYFIDGTNIISLIFQIVYTVACLYVYLCIKRIVK